MADAQMTRIDDMSYSITGDYALIEQDCGSGEVDRVSLHRIHLSLLADEMGLLRGDADAVRHAFTLERRLRLLCKRIAALDDLLWSVPCMPPGSGPTQDCVQSQTLRELAEEFCADLSSANVEPEGAQ